MPLTLEEVFEKAQGDVSIVKDGPVYYLVLNREDNSFNFDFINDVNKCLDFVQQDG